MFAKNLVLRVFKRLYAFDSSGPVNNEHLMARAFLNLKYCLLLHIILCLDFFTACIHVLGLIRNVLAV